MPESVGRAPEEDSFWEGDLCFLSVPDGQENSTGDGLTDLAGRRGYPCFLWEAGEHVGVSAGERECGVIEVCRNLKNILVTAL